MGGEDCAQTSQCSKYVRRTTFLLTLNECIHTLQEFKLGLFFSSRNAVSLKHILLIFTDFHPYKLLKMGMPLNL